MVTIAYLIIASPVLAIIFFIFYKLFLLIKEKSHYQKEIHQSYYSEKNRSEIPSAVRIDRNIDEEEDNDEEINAVISAAVSYYLQVK